MNHDTPYLMNYDSTILSSPLSVIRLFQKKPLKNHLTLFGLGRLECNLKPFGQRLDVSLN